VSITAARHGNPWPCPAKAMDRPHSARTRPRVGYPCRHVGSRGRGPCWKPPREGDARPDIALAIGFSNWGNTPTPRHLPPRST
jgi:hypothetical protein